MLFYTHLIFWILIISLYLVFIFPYIFQAIKKPTIFPPQLSPNIAEMKWSVPKVDENGMTHIYLNVDTSKSHDCNLCGRLIGTVYTTWWEGCEDNKSVQTLVCDCPQINEPMKQLLVNESMYGIIKEKFKDLPDWGKLDEYKGVSE